MNILFLCTGNSCRSQMAEAWGRRLARRGFEFRSAGTAAHGLNPRAVAVMAEAGVDMSTQQSKVLNETMLHGADLVVTVCGHADERCPLLPPGVRKMHWPLPDPASAQGTEAEVLEVFRASRDDIRDRVRKLIRELNFRAHP